MTLSGRGWKSAAEAAAQVTVGARPARRLLVAGAAGVMYLGVASSAGAVVPNAQSTPTGTPVTVAAGPGDQTDPHISGNLVTYTDFAANPTQIRYHDLAIGTDAAIPSAQGSDSLSAVSGTRVVYVHFSSDTTRHAIYYYDTAASAPPVELDPQANSNRRFAGIGGRTVVWQDFGFSSLASPEIVAYDLGTGKATRLTDDALYDRDPVVDPSGTVITWAKCTSLAGGCNIWDATLANGQWTVHQLTADAAEESSPHTNGSVVTYASDRGGDSDIRWQPVGGGPEQELSLPGTDLNPHLSGDLITFEHYAATDAYPNFDIYAYDLGTNALYRITQNSDNEYFNDVWTEPSGAAHVVWSAREYTDAAGVSENVHALSFAIPKADSVAPTISIAAPTGNATYALNESAPASYACADEPGGSGVASCDGTASNGDPVDTTSVGAKTFTVSAADTAGNLATKSVAYFVTFRICAQFDQVRSYKAGSTIPVKLRICDAQSMNVSSSTIGVTATTMAKKDSTASPYPAADAGNANPDSNFRYDASAGSYIYNLTTKGLGAGTWVLTFTVAGDRQLHAVQFDLR